MADTLRIRTYNVRFGDAILVTVPDQGVKRHILIDVGNVLAKEGGDDAVFKPIIDDILKELGGKPLDLYVMTHEHLDHAQGLFYAATKLYAAGELKKKLAPQYVWLTASAATDYYDKFPDAKKQKKLYDDAYGRIEKHLAALPAAQAGPYGFLMLNNNPSSTAQCVDYLRDLAPKSRTFYVHRGFKTQGRHPFTEAKFEIWAPEQDASDYYKALLPMALGDASGPAQPNAQPVAPAPPAGVDAGAFYDLVAARAGGFADTILAIDKAANNTSVVFALTWRKLTLLFAGDAETGSWQKMQENNVLKRVDFLKVSHHGSHNGTPKDELLQAIMPLDAKANKKRKAVISTWNDTYGGIPHSPTNARIACRCVLSSILDPKHKGQPWIDTEFKA
jgi:beta-lactamase superfamily II metal-dependent hydrolase